MRTLLGFLVKNYYYLLFLVLQGACVLLMLNNRSYQRSRIINSANAVSAKTYELVANTREYLALREENTRLAEENARLRNILRTSSYDFISLKNFRRNDTLFRQKYIYIPARVINNTTNLRSNYLTLNVGRAQGIVHDMSIINTEGIVGIVKDVSENFSSALSVLHKDVKINCKLRRDGSYGPLNWDKDDDYQGATLTDIPIHAKIKVGDTVVTSNLSSIFPEGIMVGTVRSFERKSGDAFYTVKIGLSTNFRKVNHVYVIKNFFKAEQDSLEKASQKHDKDDK
jgi:rod shape-determining protein MreC